MPRTNPKTYETSSPAKVAFIGLGVMGYPMAGHLALAGHHVTVYNRNPGKAKDWCAEFPGHASAATPREAAQAADMVFCCVAMTTICAPSCSAPMAHWRVSKQVLC